MTSPLQHASMGVLKPAEAEKRFQLLRFPPSPELAPFVKHYWIVSWNLGEGVHYDQDVIPNPCVNMVAEHSGIAVYGVSSRMYTKHLKSAGRAFGVKFHPGGFYPYIKQPLSSLTDSSMSMMDAFGTEGEPLFSALRGGEPPEILARHADRLLRDAMPEQDPISAAILEIITYIQQNRDVTRVEQLSTRFDLHIRKLQRLFHKYVGVSPKWVIQLYRLHNAAEMLNRGEADDWAKLSAELGFFDQSHFIRAFKSMLGMTPDSYYSLPSES